MRPVTRAWVRKAEEDRRVLLQLRAARPMVHSAVCFHSQQMAEKYLKALGIEHQLTMPRTHDCEALVLLLLRIDPQLARFRLAALGLSQFAVDPRYPFERVKPDASRSRTAWNAAERIRAEVPRRLGLRPLP
jgi:HEPN domain-containing protein